MSEVKTAKTAKQPNFRDPKYRKPLQGKHLRMQVDEDLFRKKGLRPFWALDKPGHIQNLIEAGYRFVNKATDGSIVEQDERDGAIFVEAAGRDRHSREPLRQYLMAIPLELYEQDQKAKRRQRAERMSQIKSGKRDSDPGDGRVDTSNEISITEKSGQF